MSAAIATVITSGDVAVVALTITGMLAATIVLSRPLRLAGPVPSTPAPGPDPVPTPAPAPAPAPDLCQHTNKTSALCADTNHDGHAGAPALATQRRISVVIPARNEERSLPRLLTSLTACRPSAHEVIVVDDGSTDDTAAIARSHGAFVVTPGEPPAGWAGKPWACHAGARQVTGDLLVFVDADTWFAPDALGLIDGAQHSTGGLLSVQPHHHPGAPVEELSLLFNLMAVMGPGEFAPGARPGRARVAFGPCVACTPADYASAGGHGAAPGAVIEDIELARSFSAAGLPVSCRLGGARVTYRMYPGGLGAIVRGWTKNIATGAAASRPAALAASVLWIAALAAVAVRLATGAVGWAGNGAAPWLAAALYVLVAVHLGWLATRVGRFRRVTAALYVIPLAFFFFVFARSMLLTALRRPVRWSGRDISTGPARSMRG